MAEKPQRSGLQIVPAIILVIAVIALTTQLFFAIGSWLRVATIHVSRPVSYKFPAYDQLLHECVVDDNVDYEKVKRSQSLQKAIDELQTISPDDMPNGMDRLCFWINTYNLLVLKTVANRYPVRSALQLNPDFSKSSYVVGGEQTSVQDVQLLRIMPFIKNNPKVLFLLNGGARGFPALLDHAIQPDRLSADEDFSIYKFVTNPRNAKLDDLGNAFLLSQLFQWHADDFISQYGTPHEFANLYLPESGKIDIGRAAMLKTYFKNFDWQVNDVPRGRKE